MSSSRTDQRIDPLIDAYRQASELEAQTTGPRPSATLRASVLAHAHVVAQSAAVAEPKLAVSETVRATPAANESKPVWRMVAGVVLGLVGMWTYQLMRPDAMSEANVAVMTAPQSGKSAVAGLAATAPAATPAQPETAVAVVVPITPTPTPTTPTVRPAPARARANAPDNANVPDANAGGARRDAVADAVANAARSETSLALAKVATPAKKAESATAAAVAPVLPATVSAPAEVAAAPAAAAATASAAASALPEAASSEAIGEVAMASADKRKSMARIAEPRTPAPVAAAAAAVSPNAFPATTAGAMASAPPPATAPQAATVSGSAMPRQSVASTPDAALFGAVRIGNINAVRAALARGANVNARDEAGKSTLQIARERNDNEMVKALDAAGAK